jgi:hypothetical protein
MCGALRHESCYCGEGAKRVICRVLLRAALFYKVSSDIYTFVAMLLSTRRPVVEVRFLLSAPIRLSLHTLQSFQRPQCLPIRATNGRSPQCLAQRRNICLYKTATAQTVLGQHKVLPFERYTTQSHNASEHLVNLKTDTDVIKGVPLQQLYDKHIKPGQILYLLDDIPDRDTKTVDKLKSADVSRNYSTYGILEAGTMPHNVKDPRKGKGIGALRVSPIKLSSPSAYFKLVMDRSYQFLSHGSPVEFTMRYRSGHIDKKEQLDTGEIDSWMWIHDHFPHVRPDFILRSMPAGSRFLVDPVTNGHAMQFVIALQVPKGPRLVYNLTNRLFKVKESVKLSISKGSQAQLPKALRSRLQREGNKAYSPVTGMPIRGDPEAKALEEQKKIEAEQQKSAAADRYLPEIVHKSSMRDDKLSPGGYLLPPRRVKVQEKGFYKKKFNESGRGTVKTRKRPSNFIDGNPLEVS